MTAQITFPSYIVPLDPEQPRGLITAEEWNNLWNLIITQGNLTTQEVELLEGILASVTDGSSGADSVGVTSVSGYSGATVQAVLEALAAVLTAHRGDTTNPHSVTKAQVGLGSVSDNLQATKTEFNVHTANTANPHGVTNAQVGLGNVTNNQQATKVEFNAHTANTTNPHSVTKAQVGLGNVDNTSDANKPISVAQGVVNAAKVDKVSGKSLILDTLIAKLEGIATGAEVNVQADWNTVDTDSDSFIKNKPTLGTVANKNTGTTSGTIPIIGAGDKLPLSVIPASAITDVGAFATIAERDAWIAADTGDVALVADPPSTYIRSSENTWLLMPTPTDSVLSVAGKTGAVTLTAADVIGALTVSDILNMLTSTATDKALSANQGKVLKDICDTIAGNLSAHLTAYGTFVSDTNTALGDRVESSTVQAVRYNAGVFEFTEDGTNWLTLTGAKGDQGRGYNPRGAWVSGGTYTFDTNTIDVVEDDGTSYYCKISHTGLAVPPISDTTHWGVLAEAGSLATGEDVVLTNYAIAASYGSVAPTDNVNQAIGKIEKNLSNAVDLSSTQTLENKNFDSSNKLSLIEKVAIIDADSVALVDSADSNKIKRSTWSNFKAVLKTYFDTLYALLAPRSARFVIGNTGAGWTAKDCDYLCDGTDDQVEINAAITALPATGGEIILLDGTYNITAKIDVNKNNVSIRGNGNATILKRMFDSSVKEGVITLTGRSGCKIANLQIEGNKTSYTNSNNYGIYLNSSSSNTVTGNTCNNNSYGIFLGYSSNNNTVTGNTCNNNNYGIYLALSNNNTVTGNTCNNNNYGIYLGTSNNNTVTSNICCNNSSRGINLSSSRDNTVTGNTCNNNDWYGIHLEVANNNNTITGNTFNNNRYGIYLSSSSNNNTVTGNTCNNNNYGIYLGTSNNNTVTSNICIRGTGLATDYTASQHTIQLSGTTNSYNLISNNNCMGKAVTNEGGTGNTLVNNKFNAT